jgi:hypothetical protein
MVDRMSVSSPNGYRMPSSIGLTTLSRLVVGAGRALRRDEAAKVVASVAALVLDAGRSDEVFRKLSHGQIGDDDLVVSKEDRYDTVVARSAEFVDLVHASMHAAFTLPAEAWLDLRFELQFFDDPEDPEGPWTYILLGSENNALESAWAGIESVERFPIPDPDALQQHEVEEGLAEREAVWTRVTAPYERTSPVSWKAPDPQFLFDIIDSLGHMDGDAARAEQGEITVTLVAEELAALLACTQEQAVEALS